MSRTSSDGAGVPRATSASGGTSGTSSSSSSHALSRRHEPSVTATGRSASPVDPPASRGPRAATAASAAAAVPDVRDTAEYRAAWDVELWKAVQADRFRAQLERERRAAMAELARVVRVREREAAAALAVRAEGVAARETAVAAAEAQHAAREVRVAEAERAVRRMREQLVDAQQRVEDEVRAQVRLANDTIAHRARLLEERVRAAEAQTQRAEERQRQAQQEYLALYEAFSRHRTQQLSIAAAGAAAGGGGGGGGALPAAAELEQLRAQWDAEHRVELDREAARHAAAVAAVEARCRELESVNRRLTAALARRREQLRVLRGCADAPATSAAPPPPPPPPPLPPAAATDEAAGIVRELQRLESDRVALVEGSSGALRATDGVIVRMDARVRDLQLQLAAVRCGGGGGA